jgi:heme/copper-type cytochrome/quinol oxidase subunit 2
MRMSLRAASRALLALAVVALVVATPGEALACPNCKSAVTDESSTGFAYAIYVMLASVFSLAGGVVWMIVRTARRAAANEAGAEGAAESETPV